MKKLIKSMVAIAVVVGVIAFPVVTMSSTASAQALKDACNSDPGSTLCQEGRNGNVSSIIGTVVNTLLYIIGAVAVIMIIIAGIRYTVSGGDSSAVSAAKNTILYAIIGLAVAFFAYAIVNWVLDIF